MRSLQGITLERLLTELQQHYGWEGLAQRVAIQCFRQNPSIASSLKFLRRTPWARSKVEQLYCELPSAAAVRNSTTTKSD